MTFVQLDRAMSRATWRLAAVYWFIYLILNVVLWGLAGVDPLKAFAGKLILVASCVVIALGMTLVLHKSRNRPVPYRAGLSFGLSVVATALFVLVDHLNMLYFLHPEPVVLDPVYLGFSMIEGLAIFFTWSCLSMLLLQAPPDNKVSPSMEATPDSELTGRQRQILELVIENKSNKEIARVLDISPLTVRNHISVLFRQFRVRRRKDLAKMAAPANGSPAD